MKKILLAIFPFAASVLFPPSVSAHAFGATYTLPIPFWLYLFAASGALILSFILIAFFVTDTKGAITIKRFLLPKPLSNFFTNNAAVSSYKALSLFFFFLTILSGLFGDDLSAYNFSMTFFWIIFFLGTTYLSFLLGDIWSTINPWKISVELFAMFTGSKLAGRIAYPRHLGYFPALLFYFFFIVIELVIRTTPFTLAIFLIQYTVITFFGIYIFGKNSWLHYGEFFSVFFRFISYCAIFSKDSGRLSFHLPFTNLLNRKAEDFSALLFILFMLSSTAFDGFRETNAWVEFYWNILRQSGTFLANIPFVFIDIFGIFLSPFFFLLFYLIVIILMKKITGTKKSIIELSVLFAFSLVPIAFVYNVAHYFTLFVIQGQEVIRLLSDPFGWGWNLFGTASFSGNAGILHAAFIWHMQVALILLGHIASVILAHYTALGIFGAKRYAFLSQLPMLFLMILYTTIGLWILSQPIAVN